MNSSRDLLKQSVSAFAFFYLPAIAIAVTAHSRFAPGLRTVVWTVALLILGAACIINARRCGRTHCYVTGPFFLVMAIATVLYSAGLLPLGSRGWSVLGLILLVGTILLCCLPERFLAKYSGGDRPG